MGIIDEPDRWVVEWTRGWVSGKRVTLVNSVTEQEATGHDWEDWDVAAKRAMAEVDRQGDLVTEVERFLASG